MVVDGSSVKRAVRALSIRHCRPQPRRHCKRPFWRDQRRTALGGGRQSCCVRHLRCAPICIRLTCCLDSRCSEGETSVLNERIEGFNEETGPFLMTFASPHLTVAGLMHFSLTLASAPEKGLIVHAVTGVVTTAFLLTSPKDSSMTARPPAT